MDINTIRTCSVCTVQYRHHGAKDSWCPLCKKAKDKAYRLSLSDEEKERKKGVERTRRLKLKQSVVDYLKEHPCVECGKRNPIVLQFDHIDPSTKVMAVSALVARGASPKKVFAEIAKCEVRCGNCHAVKTSDDQGWYAGVGNV